MKKKALFLLLFLFLLLSFYFFSKKSLKIGSKRFSESYILGEILKEIAEVHETTIDYRKGLGNTGILFVALQEGAIDIYPEYMGTIIFEILKRPDLFSITPEELNSYLEPLQLGVSNSLGFQNHYALAMREDRAQKLNIQTISDLALHPQLLLGFSHEFLGRLDGWQGLKKSPYFLSQSVKGIDHALSYEALIQGQIDVIDVYSTDPKIEKYHLRILRDNLHFFPSYEGVLLYRLKAQKDFPKTWKAFQDKLVGHLSNQKMRDLNAKAELEGQTFEQISKTFLQKNFQVLSSSKPNFWQYLTASDLWSLTKQHLFLVFGALLPAALFGVLLGTLSAYSPLASRSILTTVGVIQTLPSLALLAFLISVFRQIGTLPALCALFLYSLLPIIRNTHAGLNNIPPHLKESAEALGLPSTYRLWKIEIPLAAPYILAGIKTAAIFNVGMATIAAFIGAGGYGERIVAGLAIHDNSLLLAGALPASLLAVFIQYLFDITEKYFTHWELKNK